MTASRNLSQEAHLWYTVSSPAYIEQANEKLAAAARLLHLDADGHPFINDYAPVPYWGGRAERLVATFDHALAVLKEGDFGPMQDWAGDMTDIPRGIQEGNMNWMPHAFQFMEFLNQSFSICNRFLRAVAMSQMYSHLSYRDGSRHWYRDIPEDMSYEGNNIARNSEEYIFPILPSHIPEYAPDTSVVCQTGEIVPWTGVWVPSTGMGTAALAFARKDVQVMQPAYEIASRDEDGYATFELVECAWHPVKPTGQMIEHPVLAKLKLEEASKPNRVMGGERCPRSGLWFSPAQEGPSQRFELGDVMPHADKAYGRTLWQWAD